LEAGSASGKTELERPGRPNRRKTPSDRLTAGQLKDAALNEYTRREEVRWTLVSVAILIPSVAIAIVRLLLIQGPMVPDQSAMRAAEAAEARQSEFEACVKAAAKLSKEVPIFKTVAESAKRRAEEKAKKDRRLKKDAPLDVKIPWSAASLVYKNAKRLSGCKAQTASAAGGRSEAEPAWTAVRQAAKMAEPRKGDEKAEAGAALKLLKLVEEAPIDKLEGHVEDAKAQLADDAKQAKGRSATAKVRQALPEGLFPRGAAIGVGVGVALAALIISYISVRSASTRRARSLIGLRRFANTPEAGLQAAAIVRFAAHHNGGEPGMVLGSALGGLTAAILVPMLGTGLFIGDLYVAGAMGGLLFGLALQWLVRTISGVSRWRDRAKELGNIEKPTIPIALVLGGVTPGLEKQFLRYFEALPVADAAVVVQKLAAQAEEQILQAAEAGTATGGPVNPAAAAAWTPGPADAGPGVPSA